MIEYVELDAAKEATGIRMVVAGVVPSPWSEAAKGLFRLAKIPVLAVRAAPGNREIVAWAGADNVPVVMHDKEPVRTTWSAIVGLVARLAPGVVLPLDPAARVEAMGLIDLIAGEEGLGWNGRLAMIHAGITSEGKRGFTGRAGAYLSSRYGYTAESAASFRSRVEAQLAVLADRLAAQQAKGHEYFGGAAPSAVDVYVATFLTALTVLSEADCPAMEPALRSAFGAAAEDLGPLVPAALRELRTKMFERHLEFPISI